MTDPLLTLIDFEDALRRLNKDIAAARRRGDKHKLKRLIALKNKIRKQRFNYRSHHVEKT